METFQFYFELIGAAAFAISGAALGIRKEMDLFGVAMLGMTTAWAAACCGMCAVRSGPISSPSTCTPARRWPARRCVCCCGLWVRERP